MEGGAFLSDEFKTFAQDKVVYLNITAKIEGRKHDDLFGEKGGTGFPYLCALSAKGDVVAKLSGSRDTEGFTKMMVNADLYSALEKKAASGDAVAKIDFALMRAELGMLTMEQLTAEMGDAQLSDAQTKKLAALKTNLIFGDAVNRLRAERGSPESRKALLDLSLKLYNAGTHPTGSGERRYWSGILNHAKENQNAQMAMDVVKVFEPMVAGNARGEEWLAGLKAEIAGWSEEPEEPEEEPEEEVDEDSSIEESCE